MNDKLRSVESRLRQLRPRKANVDLDRVVGEGDEHTTVQRPIFVSRKNAFAVAGIWMSGVLAGCLIMAIAGQFDSGTPETNVIVNADPESKETDRPRPSPANATVRKLARIRSIIGDEDSQLSSASHLGGFPTTKTMAKTQQFDGNRLNWTSTEMAPRTRQQMMVELSKEIL